MDRPTEKLHARFRLRGVAALAFSVLCAVVDLVAHGRAGDPPSIAYTFCSVLSSDSVEFRAGIDPKGATGTYRFEWAASIHPPLVHYGSTNAQPLSGDSGSVVEVTAIMVNESSLVEFQYRLVISTGDTLLRGRWQSASFDCPVITPQVILPDPTAIGMDSVRLELTYNNFGSPSSLRFVWGIDPVVEIGSTPMINLDPTASATTVFYTISKLIPTTEYFFRAQITLADCPQVVGTNVRLAVGRTLYDSTAKGLAFPIVVRADPTKTYRVDYAMNLGVHTSASDCYDDALGEAALPPASPDFDVRLVDRNVGPAACLTDGTYHDLREFRDSTQVDTFRISIRSSMDYFPIDLYWMDLREHYSGPVTLKSLIDSVSMLDTTHYRITHPGISGLIITAAGPRPRLQSPNLLIEQLRGEQSSTVVLSGEVNPNGLSTAAWFEWGQTTEYDRSTVRTLVGEGFSTVGFESQISDLTANTTYHYRLVAANPADTVFGIDQVFHTSEVTGLRDSEIPSGGFSLEKNYPNPFNPSTVISYSLSVPEHVTLKIYDLHGRVIATLVDRLNQPGRYQVEWKAQGFVTGVYLCRYQAGMFIRTEKLLFMK